MIFLNDVANFEIERAGHTFPGFNRPIKSWLPGKKKAVVVKVGNTTKLLHYGDSTMQDFTQHKDKKRRKNYLSRSGGIRDKNGNLTKDNKLSPNYWSRKTLW